jgi:hypothetical protein
MQRRDHHDRAARLVAIAHAAWALTAAGRAVTLGSAGQVAAALDVNLFEECILTDERIRIDVWSDYV